MITTPEIRKFNKTDWMLLSGAEPFSDGHNPLIVDNFPNLDMTMAADKNGITLLVDDSEYLLPTSNPDLVTYTIMEEIFEAVVDCMFMASESDLERYISGFGFKTLFD